MVAENKLLLVEENYENNPTTIDFYKEKKEFKKLFYRSCNSQEP